MVVSGTKRPGGYLDYPFEAVCEKARELNKQGIDVFQKFTCIGCGARLCVERPNVFDVTGTCDQCHAITNIKVHGCNYMQVLVLTPERAQQLKQMGEQRGGNAADKQGEDNDRDREQDAGRADGN